MDRKKSGAGNSSGRRPRSRFAAVLSAYRSIASPILQTSIATYIRRVYCGAFAYVCRLRSLCTRAENRLLRFHGWNSSYTRARSTTSPSNASRYSPCSRLTVFPELANYLAGDIIGELEITRVCSSSEWSEFDPVVHDLQQEKGRSPSKRYASRDENRTWSPIEIFLLFGFTVSAAFTEVD